MYLINTLVAIITPGLIALLAIYFLNFLRVVLPKVIEGELGSSENQSFREIFTIYKRYLLESKIPITFSLWIFFVTYFYLYLFENQPHHLPLLLFSYITITSAYIDLDTNLLPDFLTLSLLWLGLLVNTSLTYSIIPIKYAIYGIVLSYFCLTIFNWLYKLIRGRDGMGWGDVKLIAGFGAWFGHQDLLLIMCTAFLLHIVSTFICNGINIKTGDERPFGPSLILAAHFYIGTFLIKF